IFRYRGESAFRDGERRVIARLLAQPVHVLATGGGAFMDPATRALIARRGVSAEAVQLFRLGYAPEAWDDTVNWAKAKHFETSLMELAGLIPEDPLIAEYDSQGRPTYQLPANSPALQAAYEIFAKLLS
ncbi:MAG: shikimate kinase, partial [Desulfobaccales bacterium]